MYNHRRIQIFPDLGHEPKIDKYYIPILQQISLQQCKHRKLDWIVGMKLHNKVTL